METRHLGDLDMKKTYAKKRMSKAPSKSDRAKAAKRGTDAIMGRGVAGQAIAKRRATSGQRLKNVMGEIRKTRKKK